MLHKEEEIGMCETRLNNTSSLFFPSAVKADRATIVAGINQSLIYFPANNFLPDCIFLQLPLVLINIAQEKKIVGNSGQSVHLKIL